MAQGPDDGFTFSETDSSKKIWIMSAFSFLTDGVAFDLSQGKRPHHLPQVQVCPLDILSKSD